MIINMPLDMNKTVAKLCYKLLCSAGCGKKFKFIILGGQKCASTSLASFLNSHPACAYSIGGKESRYFSKYYKSKNQKCPMSVRHNWRKLLFDATTEYIYLKEVAERIYKYNPDMKLILLVRNPITRAFSEYQMHYNYALQGLTFWEDPTGEYLERLKDAEHYPFEWFIEEELRKIDATQSVSSDAFQYPDFLRRGLYSIQLENYYRYFKPEQILILEDKELQGDKKQTLFRVEEFLGLQHFDWPDDVLYNRNIGKYHFVLSESCHEKLQQFFIPWNEVFFRLIGKRMDWNQL